MEAQTTAMVFIGIAVIIVISSIFIFTYIVEEKDTCLKLSCPSISKYYGIKETKEYFQCSCLNKNLTRDEIECFITSFEAEKNEYKKALCK